MTKKERQQLQELIDILKVYEQQAVIERNRSKKLSTDRAFQNGLHYGYSKAITSLENFMNNKNFFEVD